MNKKAAVDTVTLLERIAELSPRQQEQVVNFVEFLYQKYVKTNTYTQVNADAIGQVKNSEEEQRKEIEINPPTQGSK